MLLSEGGRLWAVRCIRMLLCCLVLAGWCMAGAGPAGEVTPAELDAFEAKLRADPKQRLEVVNEVPNPRELFLAGQQQRPTSQFWGLYVRSLFQRQEPGADELAAEARAKHYQDWSDYLQQFHETVVGALEEAPGEARLQFALSCVRGPLAVAAMETGDLATAKQYADQWLQGNTDTKSWNYGNVVHDANQILGRVALREGDVAQAKRFLIEAGKTPGSPQLNSFGPRMTLARELLEKGEKAVVLDYVDLVAKFWASPESLAPDDERGRRLMQDNAATVERWKVLIAAGLTPDSRHWR
jgi:hypothetical protein